jgi:hypothetical protein
MAIGIFVLISAYIDIMHATALAAVAPIAAPSNPKHGMNSKPYISR